MWKVNWFYGSNKLLDPLFIYKPIGLQTIWSYVYVGNKQNMKQLFTFTSLSSCSQCG